MSEKYLNKEKSLLQKLEVFISTKLPKGNIFNIPYITDNFVYKFSTRLDNNKATGIDNISSKIVKISAPVITKQLTDICDHSIVTAVFHRSWKRQELGLHHFIRETQPTTQKTVFLQTYIYSAPFVQNSWKNCTQIIVQIFCVIWGLWFQNFRGWGGGMPPDPSRVYKCQLRCV